MYFKQWHFSIGIFKLGANFVNYLHVLASFCIYWQLFGTNFGNFVRIFGILWPLLEALALEGHFWLILATFGQLFIFLRKFFQI